MNTVNTTDSMNETITRTTLSEAATEANRGGGIVPICPGFDPKPNAIYTPYLLAKYLHTSEAEARAYFRTLNIPKFAGFGYLGSDIIGATEELRNGTLTVKPAKRGRQEIPISNEPKYKKRPLDTPQPDKNSSLSEFKKSLKCKTVSSITRSLGAVISFHPTPKEKYENDN